MGVKNIIFDVGNVLLAWDPERIIQEAFRNTAWLEKISPQIFRSSHWWAFDQGLVTEEEVKKLIQAQYELPWDLTEHLFLTAKKSLSPKTDSIQLLQELHEQGLNIYCLTNMSEEFFQYLSKAHDFWGMFKHITVSARVKLLKPDPEIYQYVLDHNHLMAHETVLIDDMKDNIDSARAMGLKGIQFINIQDCQKELKALIGR